MAWCEVCGRWAGFFKHVHDECVAPGASSSSIPRAAKHVAVPNAQFAFGKAMPKPAMTIQTERRHRKIYIPQLHPVLMAGLSRAKIEDSGHWLSAKIAARLVTPGALDGGGREFLNWCKSSGSGVNTLDRAWHELYLWAAIAIDGSENRAEQMWDGHTESVFTHFELDSHGCRLATHLQFERFIASRNDAIWQSIWPPNDWLCGCNVLALMEHEVLPEDNAGVPGESRLDPKFATRALSWYQRSPREALKVIAAPTEPPKAKRPK